MHLNTVQLCNSAPIIISLCFVHSEGRRKEKALTLSSHSACHSTARWKICFHLVILNSKLLPEAYLHITEDPPYDGTFTIATGDLRLGTDAMRNLLATPVPMQAEIDAAGFVAATLWQRWYSLTRWNAVPTPTRMPSLQVRSLQPWQLAKQPA
jgi:hypothetical protein